jgi:hypothetical protein
MKFNKKEKKDFVIEIPAMTLQFEAKDKKDAMKQARDVMKNIIPKILMKDEYWTEVTQ